MIGGVCGIDGGGNGAQEGLKATVSLAFFAQFIQGLFGLDDLFFGLLVDIDALGAGSDVLAQSDQFTADCEVIDQLRVIAHRKPRNRRPREAREIGRAAQFLQPFVLL